MDRALALAERGRGTTRPNPMVGAVLVRDGEIVGEGWHRRAGEPHAEVHALLAAGGRARGSTLYVTLEPCAHHGRTPPCVDAVVDAGVTHVVVGAMDVDPRTAGCGVERLRAAGVEVEIEARREARLLNAGYFSVHERGRPWVILKLATTLDGGVALPERRWLTGDEARRRVHELRAWVDAVAVGGGTARADAPRLDARDVGAERQPRRLAFTSRPLPRGSELEPRTRPVGDELAALAAEGVQTLLLEGGPTLARAFLVDDLVDEVRWFIAPLVGGDPKLAALPQPTRLRAAAYERIGDDVLVSGLVHDP